MKAILFVAIPIVLIGVGGTARADFEPNNTFPTRAVLSPGVTSVSDSISPVVPGAGPDTTMGALSATGVILESDDDSSPYGNGSASGLSLLNVNSNGTIRLRVSGFQDFNFDGIDDYWSTPHDQAGPYQLTVWVFNPYPTLIDTRVYDDALATGTVDSFEPSGYASTAKFSAAIDNTPGSVEDPLDFMTFTGLPANEAFCAEITSATFDTVLGWFNADGNLVTSDDDSGTGNLSKLGGQVGSDGKVNLAVTGCADFWFEGFHAEQGDYTLQVSIVAPGDTQPDGAVDGADYTIWADNYEQPGLPRWLEGGWAYGNFTDDETADGADYTIWADNYEGGAGRPVPEPCSALMVLLGAPMLMRRRPRSA
jgi:hypothetical protein